MKEIAVIDYNAGNIQSVLFALERKGVRPLLTRDPEKLYKADKIIFPGVGEASTTMSYLIKHDLDEVIRSYKKPFLGICLGLQLMCKHSEEGNTDCLGIFDIPVLRFPPIPGLKIPHMGWNAVSASDHDLLRGTRDIEYYYFVHSYFASLAEDTIGQSEYGVPFTSVLGKDNYMATQFHPEKSGPAGEMLLQNFINL